MNTNLRALTFGAAAAVALTFALDAAVVAQPAEVIRLEPVTVTAHRANFDVDGNLKVVAAPVAAKAS